MAAFGVLEGIAFFREDWYPTLSRTLAVWLGIDPAHRRSREARIAFVIGWIALTVHLHTQPKLTVVQVQPRL